MLHLDLSHAKCKMSDDNNLTSCAHEKNACDKVFCVHTPSLTRESLLPVSENLKYGTKKIYCSFRDEESQFHAVYQLSDGRHQNDEEEKPIVVVARINITIQFMNQFEKNPFHVLQKLLVWSLSNLFLRMNPCVTTSCSCCIFSVQPVTSLLCFLVVISLIHWSTRTFRVQHEGPRVIVSASFASCCNVRTVLFCDLVVGNTCVLIASNFDLWVSTKRTVQESGQYGFVTLFVCLPESIVGFVIDPLVELHKTDSSSSDNSELTRHHIDLCSIVDLFLMVANTCRKHNIQCLFPNIVSNLGIVL